MAHVWIKKACKSPLRGLKMFTDAPPWGRGEPKLHFLRKQCKVTQIQQQQNAHSTCTMKQRHNMDNTLFETLPSFKITPFVYLIVILYYSLAKNILKQRSMHYTHIANAKGGT